MLFEYSSNNSGGSWWLKDEDWYALEKAGWEVKWYKDQTCSYGMYKGGRFLKALATNATKDFPSPKEAVEEFETITGADFSDEGCSCCGCPHSMSWTDGDGKCGYIYADDFFSKSRVNPWD